MRYASGPRSSARARQPTRRAAQRTAKRTQSNGGYYEGEVEMNFITGKQLNRRSLLRGAGAAIALPLLDAMRPALAAPARIAGQARRVAVVYVPNGIVMKDWKPAEAVDNFAFSRILKPLEPFRQDITLLSGLSNQVANKAKGGAHAKATGSFLSGAEPKYTAGADVQSGVTFVICHSGFPRMFRYDSPTRAQEKHWAARNKTSFVKR